MEASRGSVRERLFALLAFLSGMCALGYEVLYVRHLTPLFGDALHVHAALLSTFLLGLAAGSAVAYRSHRWLAFLQAGVGAWAFALPWVTHAVARGPYLAPLAGSPVATVAAVGLLVAPLALLLGMALPLFSGYVKAVRPGEGPAFQDVYAGYNLGAVVGVLLVELVLVRAVGVRGGLYLLGLVNLVIAATLWRAAGTSVRRPATAPHRFGPRVVAAVVAVGLASAVTQIFLLRSLDLVLEPHRGNFALGLAVILAGVAAGSWLVARTTLTFETAALLAPLPLLGAFALGVSPVGLLWGGPASWGSSPGTALLTRLAYAAVLGFLPMTFFGATLPALMRAERAVAEESGRLLAWAGAANAVGYLLYVGVLASRLSGGVVLAGVTAAAVGAALLARPGGLAGARGAVAVLILGAGGVVAWGWDDVDFHLASRRDRVLEGDTVEIFRWAGESATLVSSRNERWISYNGHPGIRTQQDGVVNTAELLSGVIPALAAPQAGRALVLGLGTGITAGAAAGTFREVDAVEINGAFLDMVPRLAEENLGLLGRRGVRTVLGDGRSFLAGRDTAYDAVISSVPAPTVYSAGKIYTVDFYQAVRRSLRPGGVYATWVSTGLMSREGVETVVAGLGDVFAHCALFALRSDYFMAVCSDRPLVLRSFGALGADTLLVRRLAEGLAGMDVTEYLEDILLAPDVFRDGRPRVAVANTDDRPILEFLVLGSREGEGGRNPVVTHPERYGVDPWRGQALPPDRMARRARVWAWVVPDLFERLVAPLLRDDPALREAWERLGPPGAAR